MALRIAADIGGTFTDFVFVDDTTGTISTGKVPSTPDNAARGILNGLTSLVADPSQIGLIVHGTTVGLNAFLERKGARVLLIMTAGLRDAYTIARGDRKDLYTLQYRKPERLVPRRDVLEVRERLRWDGSVMTPLHDEDFEPIIAKIKAENITAVAVCFIHAYLNPVHELRAREILAQAVPGLSVALSHEIAREWREYERASSAVMSAYIAPKIEQYLSTLTDELEQLQVQALLYVMKSNGGVMSARIARQQPVHTLLSGPVGGTVGGMLLAETLQRPNLICVDMGGTSFDVSLITNGQPGITSETELEGLPLLLPLVEIHTIGAGGGSLVWLEAGALRVGPQSAGAVPGPICYGRGGTQPTVTDANLFLGRIGADSLLGSRMHLEVETTATAMARMAGELNLNAEALAEGILAIVNAKMADAIRTITVQRGIDPREYALVAYGGAGPMHAVWLARELEIGEIIVPWSPGTFSAQGMLHADVRHDLAQNFYRKLEQVIAQDVSAGYEGMIRVGRVILRDEQVAEQDMYFLYSADIRYIGQEYSVNVPVRWPVDLEEVRCTFDEVYQMRFGHSTPGVPAEFVNLRLAAMGRLPRSIANGAPVENGDPVKGKRRIIFDGRSFLTTILERSRLQIGQVYAGPLVIEEDTATTVMPPGYRAKVDVTGNLIITPE
jgi:N-methylhydantoinase A